MNSASRSRAYLLILSKRVGGVAVPEVGGPAAQEPVDVLDDDLDTQQQPGPSA